MDANRVVIGILAHVDAGKTTLAESILYLTGSIRKVGRVDHKNAFLDTYALEKERGITIFSKQAELTLEDKRITLLDTPGHVDFSAEMERTLQVLDYAILVISGADGVQGHTQTLWKLLKKYDIPVFLFINKMDQQGIEKENILKELRSRFDSRCIDFSRSMEEEAFLEELAVCEEALMEKYLQGEMIEQEDICRLISQRKVFPCYFGSALKIEGVEEFLQGIAQYTKSRSYGDEFGARVYKIGRDEKGNRLTYMKLTGGKLKVKTAFADQKVDQIRIYSGMQYQLAEEVQAGDICAVTGLNNTFSGEGLGVEKEARIPILEPVLTYQILLPEESNVHDIFVKLCRLAEEDPLLNITWKEALNEIHVQVMGEVQIEVLQKLIEERFGISVEFGEGNIVYKETIEEAVEGVGHFEPLRHYAEVHLLLEPLEKGSGMQFETDCREDMLDGNWQRLVLTHLKEKQHLGVLTGSEITDMKITLIAGKAHLKHTEGGDFRQATYRAVRQGLKSAKSVLLEPVYEFRLEIPTEMLGRALADIQRMYGRFEPPEMENDISVITGVAPVVTMGSYQREVLAYSRGHGKLFLTLLGYEPCHNAEEVIEQMQYDSEQDLENPTGSVFCEHGAGFLVEWNRVKDFMHVESGIRQKEDEKEQMSVVTPIRTCRKEERGSGLQLDKELEDIFVRTFGPMKQPRQNFESRRNKEGFAEKTKSEVGFQQESRTKQDNQTKSVKEPQKEYLLVDGYNIIFAWEELKELAERNLEGARGKLMDILCNYQGFKQNILIVVFDAYKVEGNRGEVTKYHNIHVVYTKEAETADQYIEKVTHEIGKKANVTVATSDALEQRIIWGHGARRLSAMDLKKEMEFANQNIRDIVSQKTIANKKNYLFDYLPEELAELLEDIRLGKE